MSKAAESAYLWQKDLPSINRTSVHIPSDSGISAVMEPE